MTDTFNSLPALPVRDYNGNLVTVQPKRDDAAPHGAVNVVRLAIGGAEVNLLPEQAAQLAAGVIAAAAIVKGQTVTAQRVIEAGLVATLDAAAALSEYRLGTYTQPNLAA